MTDGSLSSPIDLVASRATEALNPLLAEMFEAKADNNMICLGELTSGTETIQVQLVVTRNPAKFLDADQVMEE